MGGAEREGGEGGGGENHRACMAGDVPTGLC